MFWFWTAVVIGAVVLTGIGLVLWALSWSDEIDFSQRADAEKIWTPEEFPNTGRLPLSTRVAGTFVRWHKPAYYFPGDQFLRMFEDSQRKWDEKQRFAGAGDNCGHYFALTESGARAEAAFYGMNLSEYRLLTADFDCDGVLDLTYERNLLAIGEQAFSSFGDIHPRHRLVSILSFLVDPSQGGTPFTDFVGHWASRSGYDGILFFGARAISRFADLQNYIDKGADEGMAGPVVHGYFHEMRQNDDLKNLVIFSGARLTAKVSTSRLQPDGPVANPYYDASDADIDAKLTYPAAFQDEKGSESFYRGKPFRVERQRRNSPTESK
jgi:hypothetical protein